LRRSRRTQLGGCPVVPSAKADDPIKPVEFLEADLPSQDSAASSTVTRRRNREQEQLREHAAVRGVRQHASPVFVEQLLRR
jgi:hypothetical protein